MEPSELTKQIAALVKSSHFRIGVYLYGARAKGTARENSDVDLAVQILDHADESQRTLFWIDHKTIWTDHLERATGCRIHLELLDPGCQIVQAGVSEASILLFESPEGGEDLP